MARTKDFASVIRAEIASDPELSAGIETEAFYADIAVKVYELRKKSGLTQAQLAGKIGTHQSVISRIEDADYEGHSLSLLKRIAEAFGRKLRVAFFEDAAPGETVLAEAFNPPSTEQLSSRKGGRRSNRPSPR